jgi:putative CocE/NonD family hydrolase
VRAVGTALLIAQWVSGGVPFQVGGDAALAPAVSASSMAQGTDVSIPMRDGTHLAGTLWLPAGAGPFAVVMLRTAYDRTRYAGWGPYLADQGLACLNVDVRGRYGSEGTWDPLTSEAQDGQDLIAWAAAQPWCNGLVGTQGASYNAWIQLLTATRGAPHLRTMVVQVCPPDPFANLPYDHGALSIDGFIWALENAGRTETGPPPGPDYPALVASYPIAGWDTRAGVQAPWYDVWLQHWALDDFWRARSYEASLDAISVPVLLGTGWFDSDQPGCIRIFQALSRSSNAAVRDGVKLIMGPWEHSLIYQATIGELSFSPSANRDWIGLASAWFVEHLLGQGQRSGAPVEYFVMGRNEWRNADTWPPEDTRAASFYFDGGSGLTTLPVVAGSDNFEYDPADPTPFADKPAGGSWFDLFGHKPFDVTSVTHRSDVLLYATSPLTSPMAIAGPVSAEVWLSSTAEDTDVGVQLVDLTPDGRAISIQNGLSRARFRNGLDQPAPLVPGEPTKIMVDLWSTAYEFEPGHRIGALVSSAQLPAFDASRNLYDDLATGTASQPATQTIYRGGGYASRLILDVLQERSPRRVLKVVPP